MEELLFWALGRDRHNALHNCTVDTVASGEHLAALYRLLCGHLVAIYLCDEQYLCSIQVMSV
jgi:hypothetical protein